MAEEDTAARAFNGLAAEVAVLRRAVEGFEGKLDRAKARNYDATLGGLREAVERAAEKLEAVEQHPALILTPEAWRQQMRAVAAEQRDELRKELDAAQRQVAEAAAQVRAVAADVMTTQQQRRSEWVAGGLGAIVGVAVFLGAVAASLALPEGWHVREKLAAVLMREDRWSAGAQMMQSANPQGWTQMVGDLDLVKANRAAIERCRGEPKSRGSLKCTIMITPMGDGFGQDHEVGDRRGDDYRAFKARSKAK